MPSGLHTTGWHFSLSESDYGRPVRIESIRVIREIRGFESDYGRPVRIESIRVIREIRGFESGHGRRVSIES